MPIALRPAFPYAVGAVLQRVAADPELATDRTVLDTTMSPVIERSIAYLINKFDQMEAQQTRFAVYQRFKTAQLRHLVCTVLSLPRIPPLFFFPPPSLLLQVQGKGHHCCPHMDGESLFFVVFCLFLHTSQRNGSDRNHLPAEPMGLENMLLTAQMESLCDQATDAAADSTARLYFVNDLLHK